MKKVIITVIALCSVHGLLAQVTIGSSYAPASNAILDLKTNSDGTSNKGLLLPRVNLDKASNPYPLSPHVAGMMVYNIGEKGSLSKGTYYNDGEKWVFMGAAQAEELAFKASNGLTLRGNEIHLGGALKGSTVISELSGSNVLRFTGYGRNSMNILDVISIDGGNSTSTVDPKVGIGKGNTAPSATLDVKGTLKVSDLLDVNSLGVVGRTVNGMFTKLEAANGIGITDKELTLGGPLSSRTTISRLSGENKLEFVGTGTDIFNIGSIFSVDISGTSPASRRGKIRIGSKSANPPAPTETLDIIGTLRVSESKNSEATTLTGRDSNGTITDMKVNNGLKVDAGYLRLGGRVVESTIISGLTTQRNFVLSGNGVNAVNLVNTISLDAANHRVGIGNTSPKSTLDIIGDVKIGLKDQTKPSTNSLLVEGSALVSSKLTVGDEKDSEALDIRGSARLATLGTEKGVEVVGRSKNHQITKLELGNGLGITNGTLSFGGDNTIVQGSDIVNPLHVLSSNSKSFVVTDRTATVWATQTPALNAKRAHITLSRNLRVGKVVTIVNGIEGSQGRVLYIRAESLASEDDEKDGIIRSADGNKYSYHSGNRFTLEQGQSVTLQYVGNPSYVNNLGEWLIIMKNF